MIIYHSSANMQMLCKGQEAQNQKTQWYNIWKRAIEMEK